MERIVRVFISSTFQDMQLERDQLMRFVFPELRERCRARQVEFVEVDLRWGITEAQSQRGETLPKCLEIINTCRPFFIGILGERYGWVPPSIPEDLIREQPWLREHRESSVTELEIVHGVLNNPSMASRAFFYFRREAALDKVPAGRRASFVEGDPRNRAKLKRLKARIRKSGMPVKNYTSLDDFKRVILNDLWSAIEAEYPAVSVQDEAERERFEQETFIQSRAKGYVPRSDAFRRLDAHVAGTSQPLVITGESGIGKSSLLANWLLHHREKNPGTFTYWNFIGSTRQSADYRHIMCSLAKAVNDHFELVQEIPGDTDELMGLIPRLLGKAAKRGKLVIVLDALNQLEDVNIALDLGWLPASFPPGVRVILSVTQGKLLDEMKSRGWKEWALFPLTEGDRRQMTLAFLSNIKRDLDPDLVERIGRAPQTGNPLFLKALLEELRVSGSHEELKERVLGYLRARTVEDLFDRVLRRWEESYNRDRDDLVQDSLSFLAASRHGLSERELLEVLGGIDSPLPQAIWSPLYLAAREFLVNRSGSLWFFHDHVRLAVERRYLRTSAEWCERLCQLSDYFSQKFTRLGERGGYRALSIKSGDEAVRVAETAGNEKLKAKAYLTSSGSLISMAVGVSHANAFYFGKAVEMVNKSEKAARKAGDRDQLAEALCRRASDETELNPDFGKEELIEEAISLHRSRQARRDALLDLARIGMRTDRPEITRKALTQAERLHRALKIRDRAWREWSAHALQYWGEHYGHTGAWGQAEEKLEKARKAYRELASPGGVCAATGWLGYVLCNKGQEGKGIRLMHRALETEYSRLGSQEGVAKWLQLIGQYHFGRKDWEKALDALLMAEFLYEEQRHNESRRNREWLRRIAEAAPALFKKAREGFSPFRSEFARYAFLWGHEPFRKYDGNPVLCPQGDSWESKAVFNPAAWTDGTNVYLLYRAEGPSPFPGQASTSSIGLATSADGIRFTRHSVPVVKSSRASERPGGCEDPRLVYIDEMKKFFLTYTAYDGKTARLSLAECSDPGLLRWKKHGPVFTDEQWMKAFPGGGPQRLPLGWSKSGAIIPCMIGGYYWMLFGDTHIWAACTRDFKDWSIIPTPLLSPREGIFDSELVEPGPPPRVLPEGILFLYNSASKDKKGGLRYAMGQALLDRFNPLRVIRRSFRPVLEASLPGEVSGQTPHVVFGEGMVDFKGKTLLYYGMADSRIGIAAAGTAITGE